MQELWKRLQEQWKTNPAVRWTGIAVVVVFLGGMLWFGREIAVFFLSVLAVLFRAFVPKPTPHDPPTTRAEESLQSGIKEAQASKEAAVLEEKRRAEAEHAAIKAAKDDALQTTQEQTDDALRRDVLRWSPSSPPELPKKKDDR